MTTKKEFDPQAAEFEIRIPFPAPPSYFDECVKRVEEYPSLPGIGTEHRRQPLVFLGKAMVDSTTHELRRGNYIAPGTDVQAIVLKRVTSLFFHLPGQAFLLQANYHETVGNAAVWKESVPVGVKKEGRAFWLFRLLVGMKRGLSWVDSPHPEWLGLPSEFQKDCSISTVQRDGYQVADPVDTEERGGQTTFDVKYRILLGYSFNFEEVENYISPWKFSKAVENLLRIVRRYARPGKLGGGKDPTRLSAWSPWEDFLRCQDSFWAQCPLESLAPAFELCPVLGSYDPSLLPNAF
jgi:hypothetical protein